MSAVAPSFPVDDQILDLLDQALNPWENGDPEAVSSSLEPFLEFVSIMAGAEPAVRYTSHDLITALSAEVRRLRADGP